MEHDGVRTDRCIQLDKIDNKTVQDYKEDLSEYLFIFPEYIVLKSADMTLEDDKYISEYNIPANCQIATFIGVWVRSVNGFRRFTMGYYARIGDLRDQYCRKFSVSNVNFTFNDACHENDYLVAFLDEREVIFDAFVLVSVTVIDHLGAIRATEVFENDTIRTIRGRVLPARDKAILMAGSSVLVDGTRLDKYRLSEPVVIYVAFRVHLDGVRVGSLTVHVHVATRMSLLVALLAKKLGVWPQIWCKGQRLDCEKTVGFYGLAEGDHLRVVVDDVETVEKEDIVLPDVPDVDQSSIEYSGDGTRRSHFQTDDLVDGVGGSQMVQEVGGIAEEEHCGERRSHFKADVFVDKGEGAKIVQEDGGIVKEVGGLADRGIVDEEHFGERKSHFKADDLVDERERTKIVQENGGSVQENGGMVQENGGMVQEDGGIADRKSVDEEHCGERRSQFKADDLVDERERTKMVQEDGGSVQENGGMVQEDGGIADRESVDEEHCGDKLALGDSGNCEFPPNISFRQEALKLPEIRNRLSIMVLYLEEDGHGRLYSRIYVDRACSMAEVRSAISQEIGVSVCGLKVHYLGDVIDGDSLDGCGIEDNDLVVLKLGERRRVCDTNYEIKVKYGANRYWSVDVDRHLIADDQTVGDLKGVIRSHNQMGDGRMTLEWAGEEWGDEVLLGDVDVGGGSMVIVMMEVEDDVKGEDNVEVRGNGSRCLGKLPAREIIANDPQMSTGSVVEDDEVLPSESLLVRYCSAGDEGRIAVMRCVYRAVDTVSDLKLEIKRRLRIGQCMVHLDYNGEILNDDKTLGEYGVDAGSSLIMTSNMARA